MSPFDVLAHECGEGFHVCDAAADDEVVASAFLDGVAVRRLHVLESQGVGDGLCYAHFLPNAVDECELAFGEHDGEGYAWESAACSEVEDFRCGAQRDNLRDGEAVEYVVRVEVVDVLAGDDVYLCVPVAIQAVEGGVLLALRGGEVREIGLYHRLEIYKVKSKK